MEFSLYSATIPSYLQLLRSIRALMGKAEDWCRAEDLDPETMLARRIAPDMEPLSYQVKSVAVHSLGAIEGAMLGRFAPDNSVLPNSFAPLLSQIDAAVEGLSAIAPSQIDDLVGRDMIFAFEDHQIFFEVQDFLLSFSQPNFYFHATTTYALLRAEGLAIGKADFLGRQRRKRRTS